MMVMCAQNDQMAKTVFDLRRFEACDNKRLVGGMRERQFDNIADVLQKEMLGMSLAAHELRVCGANQKCGPTSIKVKLRKITYI